MKIFISWSGDTSKAIAEALRSWLPSVIQAVKPYYSPNDITKGSRWNNEIGKELEECKVGLICLTADNLDAPWIMFEAGALSKSLSTARVCPLLFGVEPSDIKGPLVQFQAAPFGKEEMKKTIRMINQELGPAALTSEVLESVYEMWWHKLEEIIKKILSGPVPTSISKPRSDHDILEEILARVRMAPRQSVDQSIHPGAIADLMDYYQRAYNEVEHLPLEFKEPLTDLMDRLRRPIDHILRRLGIDREENIVLRKRVHNYLPFTQTDEPIESPTLGELFSKKTHTPKRSNKPR